MDRIVVLIPVMQWDLLFNLLCDIDRNSYLPEKVIVIANSPPNIELGDYDFELEVIDHGKNIGVNKAWNYGLKYCGCNYHLSILNDDIRITKNFFESITRLFLKNRKCGVACPETVFQEEKLRDFYLGKTESYQRMRKREGWAFTIRNVVIPQIPEIPEELFLFFGDDWIFHWTQLRRWSWIKDLHNIIYHKIGATTKQRPELRALLEKERVIYRRILSI